MGRRTKFSIILIVVLATMVGFQNCGQAKIQTASSEKMDKTIQDYSALDQKFLNRWADRLKLWHSSLFDVTTRDWGGRLGWGASYAMEDIVDILDKAPNKEIADIFVEYADSVMARRESVLNQTQGQCVYSNVHPAAPVWVSYVETGATNESLRKGDCFAVGTVHTGRILAPIARFVRMVYEGHLKSPHYRERADVYQQAIRDALDYHEFVERSTYIYVYPNDGKTYAYSRYCYGCTSSETAPNRAGIMAPTNFISSLGMVYLELAFYDSYYRTRAAAFARTVVDLMNRTKGPPGTWGYWPSYEDRIDDVSHGALVADFLARANQLQIEVDQPTLDKVISNFLDRIAIPVGNSYKLASQLDGGVNPDYKNAACGMWLRLGNKSPAISTVCEKICEWDQERLTCNNDSNAYLRAEVQLFRLLSN
jgi:hypothetical protein